MNRLEMPSHEIEQLPAKRETAAPPDRPRRRSWAWLWLLIFAAAGYGGYRYYETSQQKKQAAAAAQAARQANQAISVAAAQAQRGDIPVYLRGLGTVTAYNTVNVKPRADGPITKVYFQEGQHVKQGEPLIEIDPRPYQVALEQAKGQLSRDEAQLKDAQTDLARYQTLWQEKVIARQQLDTQQATVGQAQGTIASDEANVHNAELNLSFTTVTAPLSGRIGLRMVDVGNIVHASDPNALAVITQTQPIAVIFSIPADNLPPVLAKLHAGVTLPVYAYDRSDTNKLASGTLETVDNTIDTSTGTSRLKAIFQNQDEVLFPNQFVNCRLLLDTKRGVVLIPAAAVQRGPQGPYVYVVSQNQTVSMRPITVGTAEGGQMEVTSGIAPGQAIVTDGQDKLQNGSKVQIRPDTADNQAGADRNVDGGPASTPVTNTPPPPPASNMRGSAGSSRGRRR